MILEDGIEGSGNSVARPAAMVHCNNDPQPAGTNSALYQSPARREKCSAGKNLMVQRPVVVALTAGSDSSQISSKRWRRGEAFSGECSATIARGWSWCIWCQTL